jgi:hypothetical protein
MSRGLGVKTTSISANHLGSFFTGIRRFRKAATTFFSDVLFFPHVAYGIIAAG